MDTRAALIEGYSRSAPLYDQTAGMTYLGALWRLLPRVSLGPGPAILDVGSGTGINLLEAARVLGPSNRLIGIDMAPGMVQEARRKAALAGIPATFDVGDAQSLEFEDASFDLVICNSVYHWFPDRARGIAEMSRVLRPGGQVILTCVADPGFHEWVRVVDDVWMRLFGKPRAWLPPLPKPAEMMADLRGAGLVIEHLEYEVNPLLVQDVASFLRTMTVIAPTWLSGVPQGGARNFMQQMTSALTVPGPGGFLITTAGLGAISRKPRANPMAHAA